MATVGQTGCVIAIDGPAGAGKSTVARTVAQKLGYTYIDTGALYRALTWAALQTGIAPNDEASAQALALLAERTDVTLTPGPEGNRVWVDGRDVTEEIRAPETSAVVSFVAANERVRERLLALQRRMAESGRVVMDGRDIGTVVLPQADVKVFLTASADERARRRHAQLQADGHNQSLADIKANIERRDAIDAGRAVAPLRKAEDAIEVDTTDATIDEAVTAVLHLVRAKEGYSCTT